MWLKAAGDLYKARPASGAGQALWQVAQGPGDRCGCTCLEPCGNGGSRNPRGDRVGAWQGRRPARVAGVLGHCQALPVGRRSMLPRAASASASGRRG